jgi:ral guanine nucleotide dissociation stimulator-like 1
MYKSIMLSNREHTSEVICSAMLKHGLEGCPEEYSLSQLLPDKELMIPSNANVYYAISTAHDLNFVLRPRKPDVEAGGGGSAKADRRRDTSRARKKLLGLSLS